MGRPTLAKFIEDAQAGHGRRNCYVKHPGFSELYVRYTRRMLGAEIRSPVIDLALLTATKPGKGAFTKLLKHLRRKYPDAWIYVESVINPRFAAKLLKMGFSQQGESLSPNLYLPPKGFPFGSSHHEDTARQDRRGAPAPPQTPYSTP